VDEVTIALPETLVELVADRAAERLDVRLPAVEPWVGVDQAAEHLACKRQRIYDLVSRRTIPHRKEGSRLLFKLSHLDAWVESGGAG
jgi:excisionase family DNA binding protein